ncbi:helix-turn-helix domain-containing protein [Streptomyces sp. NPDC057927]
MAEQLRRLRVEAGAPTLRQLSKKIEENPEFPGIASPSTLSDLFSGKRLPKWPVLQSVVRALDGDERQWLLTWEKLVMLREVQALTTATDPTRPWTPYPEE